MVLVGRRARGLGGGDCETANSVLGSFALLMLNSRLKPLSARAFLTPKRAPSKPRLSSIEGRMSGA